MNTALPTAAQKLFWGDNLDELSWSKHQAYITQTVLEKGDVQAVSWLLQQLPISELKQQLPQLKLTDKSRTFWTLYLS